MLRCLPFSWSILRRAQTLKSWPSSPGLLAIRFIPLPFAGYAVIRHYELWRYSGSVTRLVRLSGLELDRATGKDRFRFKAEPVSGCQ